MGALEPTYYNIHGIWALEPYYLSPWTLRVGWGALQELHFLWLYKDYIRVKGNGN